jgi:WD40 repeat protein
LQTVFVEHEGSILSVCFLPNGNILASASNLGSVRLWDVASSEGSCLAALWCCHHHGMVTTAAFSPCGQTLASGSFNSNGTVRLWNPFEDSKLDKDVDMERIIQLWSDSS